MKKVSILCSNLSGGGALACVSIARALSRNYRIQIVGPIFGKSLWHGLDPEEFELVAFEGAAFPGFLSIGLKLLRSIDGDIVIANGQRLPSFGLGLLSKLFKGRPCILFLDEDDIALTMPGRKRPFLRRLATPNGDISTRLVSRLRRFSDSVLCGSEQFANRFGGIAIPLGRDERVFDPDKYDRSKMREKFGIPADRKVVGFIGNPRPHVGFPELVEGIRMAGSEQYLLVVAPTGPVEEYATQLISDNGVSSVFVEAAPSSCVPEILSACDIVIVPQRLEPMSEGQTPARLIDAMAMAKSIAATPVADMAKLVENHGLLIDERNPESIARALSWFSNHDEEAAAMAIAAREYFLKNLSLTVMGEKLNLQIERLLV